MANLPDINDIIDTDATEAEFQAAMELFYNFVAQLLHANSTPEDLAIATGSVTPTMSYLRLDTESAASSDDLTNILATNVGTKFIMIRCASTARSVVVKHLAGGSGQIYLSAEADLTLDHANKVICLAYNSGSTRWEQVWKNWGLYVPQTADKTAVRSLLQLGTAALVNTGTGPSDVPLNSNLGALAYLATINSAALLGNNVVTNNKILNGTIGKEKLANDTPDTLLGFNSSGVPSVFATSVLVPDNKLVTAYYDSGLLTYANSTTYNIAHGMGAIPNLAQAELVNVSDGAYPVGFSIPFQWLAAANSGGHYFGYDETYIRFNMSINSYGDAGLPGTPTNWRIRLRAWR